MTTSGATKVAAGTGPHRGVQPVTTRTYRSPVCTRIRYGHPPRWLRWGHLQRRYRDINDWERYLADNGIVIVKPFRNVSKDEQARRFLERIDEPEKNWKFSVADLRERAFWDDYQRAFQDMLSHTSTVWAPWHVIPQTTNGSATCPLPQCCWRRCGISTRRIGRSTPRRKLSWQRQRRSWWATTVTRPHSRREQRWTRMHPRRRGAPDRRWGV